MFGVSQKAALFHYTTTLASVAVPATVTGTLHYSYVRNDILMQVPTFRTSHLPYSVRGQNTA